MVTSVGQIAADVLFRKRYLLIGVTMRFFSEHEANFHFDL